MNIMNAEQHKIMCYQSVLEHDCIAENYSPQGLPSQDFLPSGQ